VRPDRRTFLRHAIWTTCGLWVGGSALFGQGQGTTHVVRRGDTLSRIARDHGVSVAELRAHNTLRSDTIQAGQILRIPAATGAESATEITYTVQRGDTLGGIARTHGVSVAALRQRNALRSDVIRVGQELIIPGVSAGPPAVLAGVIAATQRIKVDRARWRHIVAHHSGIEAGNATAYGNAHRRRGMEYGLAYHFVIGSGRDSGEGEIEIGPRWLEQQRGGHVRNQAVNEHGIGVCLVGNFENRRPSTRQLASFTALVDWLRAGQVAPRCEFTVHRWVDRNHTVCPGRQFPYDEMKRRYA
jgi:LysM repeat protein